MLVWPSHHLFGEFGCLGVFGCLDADGTIDMLKQMENNSTFFFFLHLAWGEQQHDLSWRSTIKQQSVMKIFSVCGGELMERDIGPLKFSSL